MIIQNVYISITEGHWQLVIDGPFDLFEKFCKLLIKKGEQPELFN
jgi:hypothetical protein